jgi:hypothetical protein
MFDKTHLIDDYTLSRNIAMFGLKFTTFKKLLTAAGYPDGGGFFYHHYIINEENKMAEMMQRLIDWRVKGLKDFAAIYPAEPWDMATKVPGMMSVPSLEWLHNMAANMDSIVEIGSFMGRSTYALCSGCKGKVYAVDPFTNPANLGGMGHNTLPDFQKHVGHFNNLTIVKGTSDAAALSEAIPAQVEAVFIDGDHSREALTNDLRLWGGRATKMICGHDYNDPTCPDVKPTIDEIFGDKVNVGPGTIWWIDK